MSVAKTAKRKRPRPAAMKPAELRALIAASGLTQGEAAERLGVSKVTIFRWLANVTPISRPTAMFISATIKPK